MATRSGGSRSGRSGGSRAGASGSGTSRSGTRRAGGSRRQASTRRAASARSDKSIEAFRDALERSVTLSRDRLQEVVDDAVRRGRMTRDDANELVSNLVTRGRQYTDDLVNELERLLEQARREFGERTAPTRRRATAAAGRAARAARDAADAPLAQADRLRRRAGVTAGGPVTAYDQLTANQIKSRLGELSPAELRQIRAREQRGKARKTVLKEIDRKLTQGGGDRRRSAAQ
jgi:polyhydroxyalkanoate synthesis regulator phasin